MTVSATAVAALSRALDAAGPGTVDDAHAPHLAAQLRRYGAPNGAAAVERGDEASRRSPTPWPER